MPGSANRIGYNQSDFPAVDPSDAVPTCVPEAG